MRAPHWVATSAAVLLGAGLVTLLSGCNQTSGFVMNESGRGYYSRGNFTMARREFERALMDAPENPDFAYNVAAAMRKQGDLIGAERMYRHALNLDPRHQPAHHGLAAMLTEQGRQAEAGAHIQEWVATQPYLPDAHVEMAWLLRQQGDYSGAESHLREALRSDPRHPQAMAHLGEMYQDLGQQPAAHSMYQRSLALNPFQPEVQSRLAGITDAPRHSPGLRMAAFPPGGYLYPHAASQGSGPIGTPSMLGGTMLPAPASFAPPADPTIRQTGWVGPFPGAPVAGPTYISQPQSRLMSSGAPVVSDWSVRQGPPVGIAPYSPGTPLPPGTGSVPPAAGSVPSSLYPVTMTAPSLQTPVVSPF